MAEPVAEPELAAVAASEWLVLVRDLALAGALQGAVFFALLCGLCFAAAGDFLCADDESEAGLFVGAGGLVCGTLVL